MVENRIIGSRDGRGQERVSLLGCIIYSQESLYEDQLDVGDLAVGFRVLR